MTSVDNSENLEISCNDVGHPAEDLDPQLPPSHEDVDKKGEITEEEVKDILEAIAATGKFWHDWDTLKSLLSFRLKQVLSEYPETQMTSEEQNSALGETYAELVTRLDEALASFIEGPPFTLQRLCEILLSARSIYPSLSKLALALEKNLLVTSMLSISMDPYPSAMMSKPDEVDKEGAGLLDHSSPVQNGIDSTVVDADEEMTDAEEVHEDGKNSENETTEEISSEKPETGNEQNTTSDPSSDPSVESSSPSNEQPNSTG